MNDQTSSVTRPATPMTRRHFLTTTSTMTTLSGAAVAALADTPDTAASLKEYRNQVGVTTSSFSGHLAARPGAQQFSLTELPRLMRDELDMQIIDLNTTSLGTGSPAWLDKVKAAVDQAGCVIINLKMNQRGLDMNSPDRNIRARALQAYKRSIDDASYLDIPWVRPLPLKQTPDMKIHVDSYRELADYGAERSVRLLVENYGWMENDPQSIVKLVRAIGRDVAACPDTGNWSSDEIRFNGLAASFPLAVTCDFKARELGRTGEHSLYDLKRCFQVGHAAGFRGPWCLEHANSNRSTLFRELAMLRDMLRNWINEAV